MKYKIILHDYYRIVLVNIENNTYCMNELNSISFEELSGNHEFDTYFYFINNSFVVYFNYDLDINIIINMLKSKDTSIKKIAADIIKNNRIWNKYS
jgi:hypothetical protein